MKEYKVVVVGNGGVGKSALTVRFVQGQFVHSYDATIEDSYRKQIQLDGEDCRMEILDTAGTEQFSGMRDLYVRNGQGFMLVYSIDDYASFEPIEALANYILRLKERRVPIVIVGNKCDLDSSRCVPFQKGAELAKRLDCAFYETSAKNNLNVRETFLNCARQIRLDAYGKKGKRQTLRDPNFIQNKQSKEKYEKGCCVTM